MFLKYPFSILEIVSSKGVDSKTIEVLTKLTIKKETKPLTLVLEVVKDKNTLHYKSKFKIDRKEWNLKYGTNWLEKKLDRIIKDTIAFELDIVIPQPK